MANIYWFPEETRSQYIASFLRVVSDKEGVYKSAVDILINDGPLPLNELCLKLGLNYFKVRRILIDLENLGIVGKFKSKGKFLYVIKKPLVGLCRVIDRRILEPEDTQLKLHLLSSILSSLVNSHWITDRYVNWTIHRCGVLEYYETRTYMKLGEKNPRITYSTITGISDKPRVYITIDGMRVNSSILQIRHPLKVLKYIRVSVDPLEVSRIYGRKNVGEFMSVNIRDNVRIFACKDGNHYNACFTYRIGQLKTNSFDFTMRVHRLLRPISMEVWADDQDLLTSIPLKTGVEGVAHKLAWKVREEGEWIVVKIKGPRLLGSYERLKLILKADPKYRSDLRDWIILGEARGCPATCILDPFDQVHPY